MPALGSGVLGSMTKKYLTGKLRVCLAVCAIMACLPGGALAAMTLAQMNSLGGAAQLDLTLEQLFLSCGLPAAIRDYGPAGGAKQQIQWREVAMRLSALDWDVVYAAAQPKPEKSMGWINAGKSEMRCAAGMSQLQLHAKGHVGVLSVTKKPNDIGYVTTYIVPKNLYQAHKVISLKATLAQALSASTLTSRYGRPDEVLKRPGNQELFRYWVLTLREQRPETLHAVDFEIGNGNSKSYLISTSELEFVRQRLEKLLTQWERDYVLD